MVKDDDWRLQGQERYLQGIKLSLKPYQPQSSSNDHDHCEFCYTKFSNNLSAPDLREGYSTDDRYRWVCAKCYSDFKAKFQWK
jgi:hypothetical protein